LSAHFLIMGPKIITTGVLFRKAEMADTGHMIRMSRLGMGFLFLGRIREPSLFRKPDSLTPSLTRKSRATVIIPLFEKPARASSAVRMSKTRKMTRAEKRIRPGRMISRIRAMIMSSITPRAMYPEMVIL